MNVSPQFKSVASLIGEPVRATILWNLLDGKAYTATELAIVADVSPQSISMHLNKLVKENLLTVEKQGRHCYYRFSKPEVAYVIEAMANLLPADKMNTVHESATSISSIKYCRTCYDHLAGKIGVAITEQLLKQKIISIDEKQYQVTSKGIKWFKGMDVSISDLKSKRRIIARQCLDWSERKSHLAGSLGAALLTRMLELGWLRKTKNSRAIIITSKGQTQLYKKFKLIL